MAINSRTVAGQVDGLDKLLLLVSLSFFFTGLFRISGRFIGIKGKLSLSEVSYVLDLSSRM